ncbi:MAG: fasciclin domain-containing protein [bacterium]|nr:fasciclin domain-containing protein [bacterium]
MANEPQETAPAPPEPAEEPEEIADEPADDETADETAEPAAPGTIVEVAVESGAFPTLVAAVQAAGLVEVLSGDGPFTVFAPTEDAFAAALAALDMTAAEVLANTDLLTAVLTYHVLPLAAPAEVVLTLDGQNVATVNGADITVTIDGDTVMVNNATVVATDIEASNGIIHVIDTVLLPPAG